MTANAAELPDYKALACNIAKPVSVAAEGARAYVLWPNWGGGNDRVPLLVRSRGGRWIEKWESMRRLRNFRLKAIPPGHPLWSRLSMDGTVTGFTEDELIQVRADCERENADG